MKRAPLAAILVGYAALAAVVQVHCADLLTSDGECYLCIADYLAHGDFHSALFGHWSPLAPWLTAPLVLLGMEPQYAFRLMIGLWGAAAVVGVWRVAGRLALSGAWRTAATACSALLAVEFSAAHRVGLLIAALLLFYLDAAMDERLLTSARWAAWTGALGGLAYLSKLYALPFFAVHYPLMVLAHGWVARGRRAAGRQQEGEGGEPPGGQPEVARPTSADASPPADCARAPRSRWRAMAIAWGVGAIVFALVAEPWVMALTLKYGRLTFGTAAAQTYAQFRPGAGNARRWAITGLRTPPPDAHNAWQDEDFDLPVDQPLSVFRSRQAFTAQMRIVGRNLRVLRAQFAELDRFRLGLVALALTPLALLLTWRRREAAFRHLAAALTIGVFCGGYAFLHADEERFFWFPFLLVPPITFYFVALAARAAPRLFPRMRERQVRFLAVVLGLLAAGSFADRSCRDLYQILSSPPLGREYRLVAGQLAEWGVRGPLAATGRPHGLYTAWHDGLHTAYYLDAQYAGMPAARTPGRIVLEMRAAGARTLLVWGEPRLAAALADQPALRRVGAIPAAAVPGLTEDVAVFELR